jgi:hypothetical protein
MNSLIQKPNETQVIKLNKYLRVILLKEYQLTPRRDQGAVLLLLTPVILRSCYNWYFPHLNKIVSLQPACVKTADVRLANIALNSQMGCPENHSRRRHCYNLKPKAFPRE